MWKILPRVIIFNGYHTHHFRQLLLVNLHRLLTYNTENLWVDKLSKGELVYPKWYASQVPILQQSYREGLNAPYRLTPFTQQMQKSYPIDLVYSHVYEIVTFSQLSTYSAHTVELPTWGSSILLHQAYSHNTPDSPYSEETTRLYWRVSCTQLPSSYR